MDEAFGEGSIEKNPLFLRRLDHFIHDLLLARSHFEHGLDTGFGDEAQKLYDFLEVAEAALPKAAREKAQRYQDWSIADAMGNSGVLSGHKRLVYRNTPVDFFTTMNRHIPAISKFPRIVATIPTADEDGPEEKNNQLQEPPLVVTVGDVLQLKSDEGPYYVLVTDLVDPLSFEATYAVAYGNRLWSAADIAALGSSDGSQSVESHLADDELALSRFRDIIRPGTILNRVRFVPKWWRDPVSAADNDVGDINRELTYQHFFDYRRLTLAPIDFRLDTEPWRIMHWMGCRQITHNESLRKRTWDAVVDRMYHAFLEHFLSFRPSVTQDNKLVRLTAIVEREWLLQAPLRVLKTAKYSEDANGGTLAMWVQTREEAEEMLGPSAHADPSLPENLPDTYYVIKPSTGEPHLDRHRFCIVLPMVLWFCPQKEGETDILCLKAHMQDMTVPFGGHSKTCHVNWTTKNVVEEVIEVGKMPV